MSKAQGTRLKAQGVRPGTGYKVLVGYLSLLTGLCPKTLQGDANNFKLESLSVFENALYAGLDNSVTGMEV